MSRNSRGPDAVLRSGGRAKQPPIAWLRAREALVSHE